MDLVPTILFLNKDKFVSQSVIQIFKVASTVDGAGGHKQEC